MASEAFGRQARHMAELNPHIMPANLTVADAAADLQGDRSAASADHAAHAADRTLKDYGQLKLSGRTEGLEPIRRELGARFAKVPRQAQVKAA